MDHAKVEGGGASGADSAARPLDPKELRRAFGQFATGVTIVTCLDTDGATPVGMTANSFSSVSLDPPLVLWSLDRKARSFTAFEKAERTAFSILGQDQVELSNRFAQPGADKFGLVDWQPGLGGVPLMPNAAARFECVRHAAYEGGDHVILVSRVVRFARYERRGLAFAQGRYGAVAPHPGTLSAAEKVARNEDVHPYDDFLIPLLLRAYHLLFRAFEPRLGASDATRAEMRILSILSASGVISEDELSIRASLTQASLQEAREALRGAGLIAPAGGTGDHGDAITAKGEAKLAALLREAAERERQSTAPLDATEVEHLRELLRRLVVSHQGTG